MKSIIIAIDVGSSSIHCTGYEYQGATQYHHSQTAEPRPADDDIADQTDDESSEPLLASALKGISHTIPMTTVVPNTGYIRIHEVLTAIDECVDEILRKCQSMPDASYQIVAIGFSTFVMNLVGVDIHGDPVGQVATLSYACNREDVVKECEELRSNLGPEKLEELYQRTGAPIHVSYALPQLRAFYGNEKNRSIAKRIDKWQTISSICLQRWSGSHRIQMPISYSEASWTGMLDFRTCSWDDEVVQLVETCNGVVQYAVEGEHEEREYDDIDLFPPLVHFDAPLPFLRGGISKCNDDGVNSYWERWPELRASTVNLFFGFGDMLLVKGPVKSGCFDS